ncbi:ornithine carbamoyltransferase [Anaplasma marginale str. Gypsy Plains]|uniref:ornithine carbamoyltransferase n=1 Tax=Anaplasma marginale TaxID=770 RepID=UPI0003C337C5|nr:ornithine carbamoyltransferase [Anaplasma marginale str. Gypsy Plains]
MGVAGTGVGSLVGIGCCSSASMWVISGFELKTKTVYNKLAGTLVRKNIAMALCQSSARTRASFEGDINQKGSGIIVLGASEVYPHRGESVRDAASSQYVDLMVPRTASHAALLEMKLRSNVQMINALIKKSHPYRVLAGILTYAATKWCAIFGQTVAWVCGNTNVLSSQVRAAAALKFRLLTPTLRCSDNMARKDAQQEGADIAYEPELAHAASDADVVTSDSWHSMGNPTNLDVLNNHQVDEFLIALAKHGHMLLHCMPAYVEREVGRAAPCGPSSHTAEEAGNKLRIQKALPAWRFGLLS